MVVICVKYYLVKMLIMKNLESSAMMRQVIFFYYFPLSSIHYV